LLKGCWFMSGFKLELGSLVKDKITGFQGKVMARSEWLYGCRRYSVVPLELKDGRPADLVGFDEDSLEVVEAAPAHKVKATGGPQPSESPHRDVSR